MRAISFDAETHSYQPLNIVGSYAYFDDPRTDCLLFAYHLVGDPAAPNVWRRGDPVPFTLIGHIRNGGKLAGWNVAGFDRLCWNTILVPRYGFPELPDDAWVDSMHLAASANLPRSLDGAARAVGLGFKEDLKDKNQIRRITDANKTPNPTAADLAWLEARCVQDVLMEEGVLARLPPWPQVNPWVRMPAVDLKINSRGVLLDTRLARGLVKAASLETVKLNSEISTITHHRVDAATKISALKEWLLQRGVPVPKVTEKVEDEDAGPDEDEQAANEKPEDRYRLRKNDIARLLARTDIPEDARRCLQIRAEVSKVSVQKLNRMLRSAGPDGRLRGALILMGAQSTGRWSSKDWQAHNMVRDVIANRDEVDEDNNIRIKDHPERKEILDYLCSVALATAIEAGYSGDPALIRTLYGSVIQFCSRMGRRTLAARRGFMMLNGDYSSIEARIPAWLAGQIDVVEAFRNGEDIYRKDAAPYYKKQPHELTKTQRQTGKVMRLALGFLGGVGALVSMGMNLGVSIDMEEAPKIVRVFREQNDKLVMFADALLAAAVNATLTPGAEFFVPPLGLISWKRVDDCLLCRLPSGRYLRYWGPRLQYGEWPDGNKKDRPDLTVYVVKGMSTFRRTLWRGLAVENVSQAIAADILATALDKMDQNGLEVVMHVHDFAGAESPEHKVYDHMHIFRQCMLDVPDTYNGLPMAIDTEISARFG